MKYKRAIFIAIIIIIMIFNFLLISGVLANNTQEDAMFSETDPVGTKIHYNSGGFEKATKAGGYPKKNKIEIGIDENDNNNHYLLFETLDASSDYHWDLSLKNPTRYMVFDFDIKTNSEIPVGLVTYKNTNSDSEGNIMTFEKDKVKFKNGTTYNITSGTWNNIALVCDFLNSTITAYINGELQQNEQNISIGRYKLPISSLRFHFNSSKEAEVGTNIMIDNLKIYEGTAPRDVSNAESEATPIIDWLSDDGNTIYERPTQTQIRELITKYEQENAHPRVMMNQETYNKVVQKYNTDDDAKEWGNQIIAQADNYLNSFERDKSKGLLAYTIKGGQLLDTSRAIYERAKYLSMAYILTKDSKYADGLYRIYEIAGATDGSFPDWHPSHYLDVSEMCAAYAIGYDWLYDYWSDEQKAYLEETIKNRSLLNTRWEYYIDSSDHWVTRVSNWNAVCNGGNLMGAVAVCDKYPDLCAENIALAVRSAEYTMQGFNPSGGWEEGISYWDYALSYTANMLSTLESCFATDFNLSKAPGFADTYKFRLACQGNDNVNNFHDTPRYSEIQSDTFFWMSNAFNVQDLTKLRLYNLRNKIHDANPFDMIWYNTEIKTTDFSFDNDYYFENVELVTMKDGKALDNTGAWLSFHGGKGTTSHSHLDTGTFLFEVGGVRWAIDLGKEAYSYYNSQQEKFNFYKLRPEGHNLYVINPSDDIGNFGQTTDHFAKVTRFETGENSAFSILDLSQAYEENVIDAKRGYMLSDNRRSGIVRDEITFKEKNSEIYWFMHVVENAEINIEDKHTAYITSNNKTLKFMIDSDIEDYEFGAMQANPLSEETKLGSMNAERDGNKKLYLKGKSSNEDNKHYIQCKMILADDENAKIKMNNISLDKWSLDGKITVNYIDKITGNILATDNLTSEIGTTKTTLAKEIAGFVLVEKPEKEIYTVTEQEQTVNYYYSKMAKVVVHYQTKDGITLTDDVTIDGYIGKEYTTEEKTFDKYELKEIEGNKSGTMTSEQQAVTYYYQKIEKQDTENNGTNDDTNKPNDSNKDDNTGNTNKPSDTKQDDNTEYTNKPNDTSKNDNTKEPNNINKNDNTENTKTNNNTNKTGENTNSNIDVEKDNSKQDNNMNETKQTGQKNDTSNNNSNKANSFDDLSKTSGKDTASTTAKTTLPKTGGNKRIIIILIAIALILSIAFGVKIKKYKGI